jgi:hypothetical protein
MRDWGFAQTSPSQELALLHQFSVKKQHGAAEVEFIITVKEFVTPKEPTMQFFALADQQTNQNIAPYTPCGWGKTLLEALSECIRSLNKFPYEG